MTQQLDDWNTRNINEFRANAGVVGGQFEGMPVLLSYVPYSAFSSATRR